MLDLTKFKIRAVVLTGSRAKGCWKPLSDVDLIIVSGNGELKKAVTIAEGFGIVDLSLIHI